MAAGLSALDLGSDLGGSIRMPAGYCGVFGLRPSGGVVPMRGHVPPPPGTLGDLDMAVLGPIGRGAADLAAVLDLIAGPDTAAATAWQLRASTAQSVGAVRLPGRGLARRPREGCRG